MGRHKGMWSSETSVTWFWSSWYGTLVVRHCIHNWRNRHKRDLDAKFGSVFVYQLFARKHLFSFTFSCMLFTLVRRIITEYKAPKVKRDRQCLLSLYIYSRATENRFFAGSDRFLVCKTDSVCIKCIFFGPKKNTLQIIYWPNILD